MADTFRSVCAELLAAIQLYTQLNPAASDMSASELTEKLMDAMAATVAALAQPVAEGLTDEEIISQADKFLAYSDAHMGDPARWEGSGVDLVAFTRHALARWGRPATAPVPEPGEVAELVEWLKAQAIVYEDYLQSRSGSKRLTRAADLLDAHALPTPEATND